jgi:hypothetical protein
MDLDAYVRTHQPSWQRLEALSKRRPKTGAEADELVDLYQEVATHLSVIRSSAPDPDVVAYLSGLLSHAPGQEARVRRDGAASPTSSYDGSRPRSTAPGGGGGRRCWAAMPSLR